MRRIIDRLRRTLPRACFRPAHLNRQSAAVWLAVSAATGITGAAVGAAVDAAPSGLATTRDDISAVDLARVVAITRPATDFAKSEQFELMQGGAGTSRKRSW